MRGNLAGFLKVDGGREYIIQVPGTATSKLNDTDTAALINWLLVEMGPALPRSFKPYSTAEVARLRSGWLQQPATVRAKLLVRLSRPSARS